MLPRLEQLGTCHLSTMVVLASITVYAVPMETCKATRSRTIRLLAEVKIQQTITTVQQSDIDNAANKLEAANAPNPQQILQGQILANEQLINAAQCNPRVSSNHAAGEQAPSVTVTVAFTCTGEVYDQSGAGALAQQLLMNQAKSEFGPHYTNQGSLAATVTSAILTDAGQGTITLTVESSGTWVAQFDNTSLQALAAAIAGKTKQEAQAILSANKDIARAEIQISGSNGDVLPTDSHQIRMVANR